MSEGFICRSGRRGVEIVDTGVDGIWKYQKFSDGTFSAWAYSIGEITNGYSTGKLPAFVTGTTYMIAQPGYLGGTLNMIITTQVQAEETYNLYFRDGNGTKVTGKFAAYMTIFGNWI